MTATSLLLLALTGCEFLPFITDDAFDHRLDLDGDGVSRPSDCDDSDAAVNQNADEICDNIDNNCDGIVDKDAVDAPSWYADVDGDGYGFGVAIVQCSEIEGYATEDGDCDDQHAAINPSADEVCDGVDNNCDELVDNDPTDGSAWYADLDGDTYGDANAAYNLCAQEDGTVADATDCDDTNAAVNQAATELCEDEIDNNCNGEVDEDTSYLTQYMDVDGDGYGDASVEVVDCIIRAGYVLDATDCDDTDADVNPGITEICNNGIDDNCDGGPSDCVFEGEIIASDAIGILTGESEEDRSGASLAGVGDMDGDGTDDLMMGGYSNDRGEFDAGTVYIVSGPITGLQSLTDATTILIGTESKERAGYTLASAGDMDNDGWNDVIIGAYGNTLAGSGAGAAYILHGPITGTSSLSVADSILVGNIDSSAGNGVASAGDINTDGFDDVLVGAPGDDTAAIDAGTAYLVFGSENTGTTSLSTTENLILTGETTGDYAGRPVSSAGDLDGDGIPDILVSAVYYHDASSNVISALYVIYGPQNAGQYSLADANTKIVGANAGDEFAQSANKAGDTNQDGYNEIIVGAPANDDMGTDAGSAYLLGEIAEGSSTVDSVTGLTTFTGRSAGSRAGQAVIGTDDLDVDGFDDVVVGSYLDDESYTDDGAAFVFFGPVDVGTVDLDTAETMIFGESANDQFGWAMASTGDLNEDSFPDFAVSAYFNDRSVADAGTIYIFSWLEL